MTTGEKIYNLRKQARITQEEFADKMEVTRQAVSKWESDATYPETDKIIKIAELFGVSCDYLLKENQVINDGARGKTLRAFLSMMISFSVGCIALGLVIALICYFAVPDWYSCLIGLGVLAGLDLAAFILWSVGRYRFLSQCDYSETDKKHLAVWTKAFFYTVIISLFIYLPSVVFVELTGKYITGVGYTEITVSYLRKLTGGEFALSALIYGVAGYCVSAVFDFAHKKVLGKEVDAVKLTDSICVAVCLLAGVAVYSVCLYKSNYAYNNYDYYKIFYGLLLALLTVVCLAVIAQSIVHKIFEKTPLPLFILQIVCAVLFFAVALVAYLSLADNGFLLYYISLALGGLVTTVSVAMIVIASVAAVKKKDYKQIMSIRLSVLTYLIFGGVYIDSVLADVILVNIIAAVVVYAVVAAVLHAPFVKPKEN